MNTVVGIPDIAIAGTSIRSEASFANPSRDVVEVYMEPSRRPPCCGWFSSTQGMPENVESEEIAFTAE